MNWWIFFPIALIPLLVGAIYYHPKAMGGPWMRINGFTEESLSGGSMLKIYGFAYLLSLLVTFLVGPIVLHQTALSGIFGMMPAFSDPNSELWQSLNQVNAEFGLLTRHRTFGHGVVHGILYGIVFVGSIIGINSIFERRSWKYTLIHTGYWTITLALMGGFICQFLKLY